MAVKVTIGGQSSPRKFPERARLYLAVEAESSNREDAIEYVRTASIALQARLNRESPQEGIASSEPSEEPGIISWTMSGMTTRTHMGTTDAADAADDAAIDTPGTSASGDADAETETDDDFENETEKEEEEGATPTTRSTSATATAQVAAPLTETRLYAVRVEAEALFRNFGTLSDMATELSTDEFVVIRGIEWTLRPESRRALVSQATKDAYANALLKAGAYAEAMGMRRVAPVGIVDAGDGVADVSQPKKPTAAAVPATASYPASPAVELSGEGNIDLVPRHVSLRGECQVTFEIS